MHFQLVSTTRDSAHITVNGPAVDEPYDTCETPDTGVVLVLANDESLYAYHAEDNDALIAMLLEEGTFEPEQLDNLSDLWTLVELSEVDCDSGYGMALIDLDARMVIKSSEDIGLLFF